jgi:hypothetical protein
MTDVVSIDPRTAEAVEVVATELSDDRQSDFSGGFLWEPRMCRRASGRRASPRGSPARATPIVTASLAGFARPTRRPPSSNG